jgi:hypothetical protein
MLLTLALTLLLAPLMGPGAPRSLAPLLAAALLGGAALGLRRRRVRPSHGASQTVG